MRTWQTINRAEGDAKVVADALYALNLVALVALDGAKGRRFEWKTLRFRETRKIRIADGVIDEVCILAGPYERPRIEPERGGTPRHFLLHLPIIGQQSFADAVSVHQAAIRGEFSRVYSSSLTSATRVGYRPGNAARDAALHAAIAKATGTRNTASFLADDEWELAVEIVAEKFGLPEVALHPWEWSVERLRDIHIYIRNRDRDLGLDPFEVLSRPAKEGFVLDKGRSAGDRHERADGQDASALAFSVHSPAPAQASSCRSAWSDYSTSDSSSSHSSDGGSSGGCD